MTPQRTRMILKSVALFAILMLIAFDTAAGGSIVWVTYSGEAGWEIIKLCGDSGTVLLRMAPGGQVDGLDIDPDTGDLWIARLDGIVRRYSASGVLQMEASFVRGGNPPLGVYKGIGEAWAWVGGFFDETQRLAYDGTRLARAVDARIPHFDIDIDPYDGTAWLSDVGQYTPSPIPPRILHIRPDGTTISATPFGEERNGFATGIGVDTRTGAAWASLLFHDRLVKLDPVDGTVVQDIALARPGTVEVDSTDGSLWSSRRLFGGAIGDVRKYDEAGNLLFSLPGYGDVSIRDISLDPTDGSVWIVDRGGWGLFPPRVEHVSASGELLLSILASSMGPDPYADLRFVAVGRPESSPAQAIDELISTVEDMNLQQGIENSLDAKLNAVLQALDDVNENNDVAAINSLEAFINAVEAQRGNKISEKDADELIAIAQQIINLITAG